MLTLEPMWWSKTKKIFFKMQSSYSKLIFDGLKNHIYYLSQLQLKAYFLMKPDNKFFSLLDGKIEFELALKPSTASTAKIQIQFSRHGRLKIFCRVS